MAGLNHLLGEAAEGDILRSGLAEERYVLVDVFVDLRLEPGEVVLHLITTSQKCEAVRRKTRM